MDMKGRLAFVCGPTWGHVDMNRPALEEAARRLRNKGAETVVMRTFDGNEGDRYATVRDNVHELTKGFEGRNLYDALVCLPRTETTNEGMLLREVAIRCGIPIVSIDRALS